MQCEACKEVYGDDQEKCSDCKPEYLEENAEAIYIFFLVRNQLIMGYSGPVDINHLAIHSAMNLYEIKEKKDCFEKILFMGSYWLNKIREKG